MCILCERMCARVCIKKKNKWTNNNWQPETLELCNSEKPFSSYQRKEFKRRRCVQEDKEENKCRFLVKQRVSFPLSVVCTRDGKGRRYSLTNDSYWYTEDLASAVGWSYAITQVRNSISRAFYEPHSFPLRTGTVVPGSKCWPPSNLLSGLDY